MQVGRSLASGVAEPKDETSLVLRCLQLLAIRQLGCRTHPLSERRVMPKSGMPQGVRPKVVQERLGDAQTSTTMDMYSHVMPSTPKEAVEKFAIGLKLEG